MKLSIAISLLTLPLLGFAASAPAPVNADWGIGSFGGKVGVIAYEDRWIPEDTVDVKSSKDLVEDEVTTIEDGEKDEEEPVTVTSTQTVYTTTTVSRTHGAVEAEATPPPVKRSAVGDIHEHHAKRHTHGAKRFVMLNRH